MWELATAPTSIAIGAGLVAASIIRPIGSVPNPLGSASSRVTSALNR